MAHHKARHMTRLASRGAFSFDEFVLSPSAAKFAFSG
jgi:hypothetical protein